MNSTTTFLQLRRIHFLLSILFISTYLHAGDDLKEVRYLNGHIVDTVLPYGEPFVIKGSAVTAAGDTATLVIINVTDTSPRGCKLCESSNKHPYDEQYFWQRQGKESEFSVVIGRPLDLDNEYDIEITLFIPKKNPPELMSSLFVTLIDDYNTNLVLSSANTLALLQSKVDQLNATDKDSFNFKNPALKGIAKIKLGPSAISFADHINELISENHTLIDKTADLDTLNMEQSALMEQYQIDVKKWAEALKAAQALKDKKARDKAVNIAKKQIAIGDSTFKSDSSEYSDKISRQRKEVHDLDSMITPLREEIKNLYDGSFDRLSFDYVSQLQAVPMSAGAGKTKSDELRIHVDYGMAYTTFNGPVKYGQTFGYWGAKIFFCQLDKSMSHPYRNHFFRRFSIVIGSVLPNKLSYKGSNLGNVQFLNLKPVIAVGFDVNKFIGINFGTIVFTQADPNPLIKQSYTVFSSFASISIDLNLLNKIKNFQNP